MNTKRAYSLAQQYVDEVVKQGFPLVEAKIFGSYATGNADEWSDIDVCLVSPAFTNRFDSRVELMHLKHSVSEKIEPHPFTPEDIQSKWLPIAVEINKYGIPLEI